MVSISKHILATLNSLTFPISLFILISTTFSSASECDRSLNAPLVAISLFTTLVSIAGFLGACFRIRWLLLVYLSAMLFMIIVTIGFFVFAFIVAGIGHGREVPGRAYREYVLEDYAVWLRRRVGGGKWNGVRSCLAESKVCQEMNRSRVGESAVEFYNGQLNAVQSGCCKPPSECGFTYINPTNWTKTNGHDEVSTTKNPDCGSWDDDPNELCYDCDSCKAAFLDSIKTLLRRSTILAFVFIGFLVLVYVLGYLAFRDQMWDELDGVVWSDDVDDHHVPP